LTVTDRMLRKRAMKGMETGPLLKIQEILREVHHSKLFEVHEQ